MASVACFRVWRNRIAKTMRQRLAILIAAFWDMFIHFKIIYITMLINGQLNNWSIELIFTMNPFKLYSYQHFQFLPK